MKSTDADEMLRRVIKKAEAIIRRHKANGSVKKKKREARRRRLIVLQEQERRQRHDGANGKRKPATVGQLKGLLEYRSYARRRLSGQVRGIRKRLVELGEGSWLEAWDADNGQRFETN